MEVLVLTQTQRPEVMVSAEALQTANPGLERCRNSGITKEGNSDSEPHTTASHALQRGMAQAWTHLHIGTITAHADLFTHSHTRIVSIDKDVRVHTEKHNHRETDTS